MADKKINVSVALPSELVAWADAQINDTAKYVSRSHVLTVALAKLKAEEEDK